LRVEAREAIHAARAEVTVARVIWDARDVGVRATRDGHDAIDDGPKPCFVDGEVLEPAFEAKPEQRLGAVANGPRREQVPSFRGVVAGLGGRGHSASPRPFGFASSLVVGTAPSVK